MAVHVVGNLCFDTTLRVPRFPEPGETMVALGTTTELGGKGLNQAVAAARAGAAVTCHAAVGADDLAGLRDALAREPRLVLALDPCPVATDRSTILVRPDGENLIVSATACARALEAAAHGRLSELARPGDFVLMQGNLARDATLACLEGARRRGAVTVLNPSPAWPDPRPDWGAVVDWLVLNAAELAHLAGEPDPDRAAALLLARGVGALAVTLGPRGALLLTPEYRFAVQAPAVTAIDSTGAGDVFCGVLAAQLCDRVEPGAALARATAAASLSVTREGALAGCPTADEIAALPLPPIDRSAR